MVKSTVQVPPLNFFMLEKFLRHFFTVHFRYIFINWFTRTYFFFKSFFFCDVSVQVWGIPRRVRVRYYSKALLRSVNDSQAFGVWRLKINAFRGTRSFFNSWRTEATCLILGVKARVLKYFINGKSYVCLTNDPSLSRKDVKDMYASRWRVEESFKRLKSNLKLEKAHARTPALYIQEVEARILLDTITLRMQTKAKEPSYIYTLDTYVTRILWNVKNISGQKPLANHSRLYFNVTRKHWSGKKHPPPSSQPPAPC